MVQLLASLVVREGSAKGIPSSPCSLFSRRISLLVSEDKLHTIMGSNSISTSSQVLIAHDILVFGRGIKRNLQALMDMFKAYGEASSQFVNSSKCRFSHIILVAD